MMTTQEAARSGSMPLPDENVLHADGAQAPVPSSPPIRERPAVVTIFAYALLIGAGTSSCLLVLYGKSYLAALAQPDASLYLKVFWASCWYHVLVPPLQAYALLKAKRWARPLLLLGPVLALVLWFSAPPSLRVAVSAQLLNIVVFVYALYLLTRTPSNRYFREGLPPPAALSWTMRLRSKVRSILYVLVAIYLVWTFNALILDLPRIYPATYQRDKLGFIALPILLLAEILGGPGGAIKRLFNLCASFAWLVAPTAFAVFMSSPGRLTQTHSQLVNWAFGLSIATAALFYLKRRAEKGKAS